MSITESLSIVVAVERRRVIHQWTDATWHVVGVLPAAAYPGDLPRRLHGDEMAEQYLLGPVTVTLHRSDVSSYRYNLGFEVPQIFIGLRRDEEGAVPWRVVLATVAPDDAQSLMEHGDDLVNTVSMPPDLLAWVRDFTDRAPPEEVFHKRRRKEWRPDSSDE